jgi:hypothetical protein
LRLAKSSSAVAAPTPQGAATMNDEDIDSQIATLRADARLQKVQIIKDAMKFNAQESSSFWPIYEKYQRELSALNDERIQLIKTYADKFGQITDADAKAMAEKSFDLDSQRRI